MLCSTVIIEWWQMCRQRRQDRTCIFTSLDYMIISLLPFVMYIVLDYIISLFPVVIYLVPGHYQRIWKRIVSKRRWWPYTYFSFSGLGLLPTFPKEFILSSNIWLMKFVQLSLKFVLHCFLSIKSNICNVFHANKTGGTCVYFFVMVLCVMHSHIDGC